MVDRSFYRKRKICLLFIFAFVAVVYIVRLFFLQILDDSWEGGARANAFRHVADIPPRGLIFDRNGEKLVDNEISYDLMVVPRNIRDLDTLELCNILDIDTAEFNKRLSRAKRYSTYAPSLFARRLPPKVHAFLTERLYRFKGFYIYPRTVRTYYTQSAAHSLGYIAEVNYNDMDADPYYAIGDYIGRSGIERSYEEELRGKKGQRIVLVDNLGREKGSYYGGIYDIAAIPGKTLWASIDKDLQEYGELLMQGKRGSIVVIEPSTGEILCLVTSPSYDPSLLVGSERGSNYMKLHHDSINKPLFNRALNAMYPPGSTFKLANALVFQQAGTVNEHTLYGCQMGFTYGNRKLGCHAHPSPLDVSGSVQHSCNAWYCRGLKSMLEDRKRYHDTRQAYEDWYRRILKLGFGQKFNSDLPYEIAGIIPSADYYDKVYGKGRWQSTSIISISIGQGEICATPLQLANLVATIANKGYYYPPHLIRAINHRDSLNGRFAEKKFVGIDPKYFVSVTEGMERATLAGTARRASVPGIRVAAKTGTAENPPKKDHSLLVCFAPVDDPKIAISIIVENGGFGATWAAPIASLMMERYLNDTVVRTDLEDQIKAGKIIYW
ncbi:MAG: penicillin-binding protein 2 [Bacteroidales bacterium]|jgi:penicillin-binding protein 2|nr:penicillin-binding protein 2 [Bacteroidales bacterium]